MAGATFKEERSGQLSILSLFQVGFPKIDLADLILADHRLCLGPGHTISCHTSWLQPGIFGGAPQVKKCHRLITPPPAWTCIMYHPSLDMYTLTGWIGVAAGFLSLILFMPGVFQVLISIQITQHSEEWEDPLKSSYRSFQCQKERGSCPMEMKAKQEWLPALQILSTLLISSCVNVMNSS